MSKNLAMTALAAVVLGSATIPVAAPAQNSDRGNYGQRNYDQRNYDQQGRNYRGRDEQYRQHCGSGNGAVGTVAGGVGGALIGNAIGGGTLGTVAGGVGGALLGRHLDKKHTADKNRREAGC